MFTIACVALRTLIPRSWYPSDIRSLFSRLSPRRLSSTVMEELPVLYVASILLASCCAAFSRGTVTAHHIVRRRKVTPSTICIQRIHCSEMRKVPDLYKTVCRAIILCVHVYMCVYVCVCFIGMHRAKGRACSIDICYITTVYMWHRI